MKNKTKEELIVEWKRLRGCYFNLLDEDFKKFQKQCSKHPLYDSVVSNFDKSFKEINQIAEIEVDKFINLRS
jgi:hypothetical protein